MEITQAYERIIKQKCVGRVLLWRIVGYSVYVVFALLWVIPILESLLHPLMIALAVLTTLMLVLLSRKYLHAEYEYVFVGGELTVSKIYGKKKRRSLLSVNLRDALLIAPADEEGLERAEALLPTKVISALGDPDTANALCVVFEKEKQVRCLLFIESDERTVSVCRRAAPAVCSAALRNNR